MKKEARVKARASLRYTKISPFKYRTARPAILTRPSASWQNKVPPRLDSCRATNLVFCSRFAQ